MRKVVLLNLFILLFFTQAKSQSDWRKIGIHGSGSEHTSSCCLVFYWGHAMNSSSVALKTENNFNKRLKYAEIRVTIISGNSRYADITKKITVYNVSPDKFSRNVIASSFIDDKYKPYNEINLEFGKIVFE